MIRIGTLIRSERSNIRNWLIRSEMTCNRDCEWVGFAAGTGLDLHLTNDPSVQNESMIRGC